MPLGSVLVMVKAAGAMTIVWLELTSCCGVPASATFTVTGELPAVVGVPLTVQPVSVKPAGRDPVIEQL